MRDLVRVKLVAEKRSIYEFEELFQSRYSRWKFFESVLLTNRIKVGSLNVQIVLEGNILRVIYDDYSKYDVSYIDEFYSVGEVKTNGSYMMLLYKGKAGGILQDITYRQIDEKKSELKVQFRDNLGSGKFEYDIVDYLEDDGTQFAEVMEVVGKLRESLIGEDNESFILCSSILAEFILNLAQHSVRGKGYVTIEGDLHSTVGGGRNVLVIYTKQFLMEDILRRLQEIKEEDYKEVRVLERVYKDEFGDEISLKYKRSIIDLAKTLGLQIKFK